MSKKTVTAIVIDAENRTVREVEIEQGSLQDIYKALGPDVRCFTSGPTLKPRRRGVQYDGFLVDDEGLLKAPEHGWALPDHFPQALAGNGILTGVSPSGNTVSTTYDVETVRSMLGWVSFTDRTITMDRAYRTRD